MWTVGKAFLVAAAIALASTAAQADIIVTTGVSNTGTDNVLLNPANDVLTVTGTVGANDAVVNFTSTSGSKLLDANPSGQATVSGGAGNTALTQLTFGLANGDTFTKAVFNVNASTTGDMTIKVEGINITGGTFTQSFVVDANGQNFFTVTAINSQFITKISLEGINNPLTTAGAAVFEDVRQVRLGGGTIVAVPAPLVGAGLPGLILACGGLMVLARRRRQAVNI